MNEEYLHVPLTKIPDAYAEALKWERRFWVVVVIAFVEATTIFLIFMESVFKPVN